MRSYDDALFDQILGSTPREISLSKIHDAFIRVSPELDHTDPDVSDEIIEDIVPQLASALIARGYTVSEYKQ
jgi:hypothetical protein